MKILVTGANGFIGQGIVKKLLDMGHEVIATDLSIDYVDERANAIAGNIFEYSDPYNEFLKPTVLLHLAWRNGFIHNDLSHIEDLPLHYMFIKKLADSGLKHIAILGSMHEIGFFEGSVNENTETNPQTLYGISKDALRRSISLLCLENNITFQWIRGFYIVGNTKFGSSIFSKIVQAEENNETEFPFTQGKNQYDFINYDDFCEQISCIITQNKYKGIINACSGYPEKLSTVVEKFIADNNFKIKLKYGAFPDRPYDSKAIWGDNTTILKILKEKGNCHE